MRLNLAAVFMLEQQETWQIHIVIDSFIVFVVEEKITIISSIDVKVAFLFVRQRLNPLHDAQFVCETMTYVGCSVLRLFRRVRVFIKALNLSLLPALELLP